MTFKCIKIYFLSSFTEEDQIYGLVRNRSPSAKEDLKAQEESQIEDLKERASLLSKKQSFQVLL